MVLYPKIDIFNIKKRLLSPSQDVQRKLSSDLRVSEKDQQMLQNDWRSKKPQNRVTLVLNKTVYMGLFFSDDIILATISFTTQTFRFS